MANPEWTEPLDWEDPADRDQLGEDFYALRHTLAPEQVFYDHEGGLVKLDRRVPGDGTQWYVARWNEYAKGWSYEDSNIEPGDLLCRADDPTGGQS